MDLIINLSTSGIRRSAGAGLVKRINRVFGTTDWQTVYDSTSDSTLRRRALIDLYLGRLRAFGYVEFNQTDIPFKNKKGVQVYSLMFASKHKLGEKFWSEVTKRTGTQRLPGF
jgi:three-Cys-motif partner protein